MRCVFLRCNNTEIHEQASFCKFYSLRNPSEQIMCYISRWDKDSHVALGGKYFEFIQTNKILLLLTSRCF